MKNKAYLGGWFLGFDADHNRKLVYLDYIRALLSYKVQTYFSINLFLFSVVCMII